MTKENLTSVIELFSWSDIEEREITALKGAVTRNTLAMKQYMYVCYLLECAYALALEPRRNLSENHGCEWQLKYYGR